MVDLDILEAYGVSTKTLKETFTLAKQKDAKSSVDLLVNGDETTKKKVGRLLHRIASRIRGGRDFNLSNYRIFHAIDESWDSPLKQITPTMLMTLVDKDITPEAAMDKLKTWGINPEDYITEYQDPKTPGVTQKKLNVPAFFPVRVNLAKGYTTIRWAKLTNDRHQVPHFKFEPAISNQIARMRAEVITARVEAMSNQYGYFETEKQAILKMLVYGQQLLFPVEAWHYETQLVGKDSPYKGETVKHDGKEFKEAVIKEGIRYHIPHPARTYRDHAHFPSTFNTDTGARYAGYWRIQRFREIANNENFWNLDAIRIPKGDWYTRGRGIFENVYPCTITLPSCASGSDGVGDQDSEKHVGDGFYSSTVEDQGVLINEYFEKLNPKDCGLGDYDHDVWFRFVLAGDDTVIFCEPLAYSPIISYAYDADEGKKVQSSMMLEVLPFEIQLSNLFTQYIISVIQNLYNITLVDRDVLSTKDIDMMKKAPSVSFVGMNVVSFSSQQFKTAQTNPRALYSERFPQVDVNSIAMAMRMTLEMVERLLVMSPQEMGQAATHEQTREEVKVISAQSSARLEFTGISADRAREAIKHQLYEGLMAYGEDEFYAQVPADPEITPKMLKDLGFTWEGMDEDDPDPKVVPVDTTTGRITVRTTKTAVMYEKFVASRDGADRINEEELARAMANFMAQMMGNQITAQAIGPDQAIQMINTIARAAGFPRDFKLVNKLNDKALLAQNNEELMQQVQQLIQQSLQQVSTEVKNALGMIMKDNAQQEQAIQANTQATQANSQSIQEIQSVLQPQPPQVMPMPAQMPTGAPPGMPAMM